MDRVPKSRRVARDSGGDPSPDGALTAGVLNPVPDQASAERFVSEDPIGFAGGDVNLYAHVGSVPTVLIDPEGLVGLPPAHPPNEVQSDPLKWLWDRLVGFADGLQDWWSHARKDWWWQAWATRRALADLTSDAWEWFRNQIRDVNPIVLLGQCAVVGIAGANVGARAGALAGHPIVGAAAGAFLGCLAGLATPVTPPGPGP